MDLYLMRQGVQLLVLLLVDQEVERVALDMTSLPGGCGWLTGFGVEVSLLLRLRSASWDNRGSGRISCGRGTLF